MLRWRLVLGVVFVGGLVGVCWLDARATTPGTWLFPLALVVTALASGEMIALARNVGVQPAPAVYLANVLVVAVSAFVWWWPTGIHPVAATLLAMVAGLGIALADEMRRYERPGGVMNRLAMCALALGYIAVPLALVIHLRMAGPDGQAGGWGIGALASLLVVVKLSDIGAYTAGRLFGRHKMAPVLSPGKTWEGALGGLLLACAGSWIVLRWLAPWWAAEAVSTSPPWGWLAYGLLVGAAGMFGDLAESLLKRDAGTKDSSTWMPGFGGVLDLLDSVLLAAPVAYLCWQAGLAGP